VLYFLPDGAGVYVAFPADGWWYVEPFEFW
jgi:hypothetical protein